MFSNISEESSLKDLNETQKMEQIEEERRDDFSKVNHLRWGYMPLTYGFETECIERLQNSIRLAFESVENETGGIIYFEEVLENPDISIHCVEREYDKDSYTTTIGGARCFTYNEKPNLIMEGEIYIYGQGMVCGTGYPSVEVHEILHLFGFLHNPSPQSIMFPYTADSSARCKTNSIDKIYINCLRHIYSNGTIQGDCPNIDTLVSSKDPPLCPPKDFNFCSDGWYPVKGTRYCCPEPNMRINKEGNCAYEWDSEKIIETNVFDSFEEFAKEYDLEIILREEEKMGIAEIDLTNSFIDNQIEKEKNDFVWKNLYWAFLKLSEEIKADNYKVVFIRTSGEYIFNFEYTSTSNFLSDEGVFFENLEIDVI